MTFRSTDSDVGTTPPPFLSSLFFLFSSSSSSSSYLLPTPPPLFFSFSTYIAAAAAASVTATTLFPTSGGNSKARIRLRPLSLPVRILLSRHPAPETSSLADHFLLRVRFYHLVG
ncbi:hypothetical protein SprV_0100453800 [Sparganum proliferum]